MRFGTIWERYFFKSICKNTVSFLLIFFLLYSLIDYSSHAASFHKQNVQFRLFETFLYYGSELLRQLNILLPFAILIASVRVLTSLNTHNELIALLSSGISLKTLMRPFILFGLICTLLTYLNSEFFETTASEYINRIESLRSSKRHKQMEELSVQRVVLTDGTHLIFHHFEGDEQRFFDVYWIQDIDNVYRMKYLYPLLDGSEPPMGHFVDQLKRNRQDQLVVVDRLPTLSFPLMKFNKEALFDAVTAPDELPISKLWQKLPPSLQASSEKESQIVAAFMHKWLMPWLCLLAVIGPAPFCVRFTRNLPVFFIYAGSFFGLVVFGLVMKTAFTLAERQVFTAWIVMIVPFMVMSLPLAWRFARSS